MIGICLVWIEPPIFGGRQSGLKSFLQRWRKVFLDPAAALFFQSFDRFFSFALAGGGLRIALVTEAEKFLPEDQVDVLGKALDQFPCLGKGSSSLEGEVIAKVR